MFNESFGNENITLMKSQNYYNVNCYTCTLCCHSFQFSMPTNLSPE